MLKYATAADAAATSDLVTRFSIGADLMEKKAIVASTLEPNGPAGLTLVDSGEWTMFAGVGGQSGATGTINFVVDTESLPILDRFSPISDAGIRLFVQWTDDAGDLFRWPIGEAYISDATRDPAPGSRTIQRASLVDHAVKISTEVIPETYDFYAGSYTSDDSIRAEYLAEALMKRAAPDTIPAWAGPTVSGGGSFPHRDVVMRSFDAVFNAGTTWYQHIYQILGAFGITPWFGRFGEYRPLAPYRPPWSRPAHDEWGPNIAGAVHPWTAVALDEADVWAARPTQLDLLYHGAIVTGTFGSADRPAAATAYARTSAGKPLHVSVADPDNSIEGSLRLEQWENPSGFQFEVEEGAESIALGIEHPEQIDLELARWQPVEIGFPILVRQPGETVGVWRVVGNRIAWSGGDSALQQTVTVRRVAS